MKRFQLKFISTLNLESNMIDGWTQDTLRPTVDFLSCDQRLFRTTFEILPCIAVQNEHAPRVIISFVPLPDVQTGRYGIQLIHSRFFFKSWLNLLLCNFTVHWIHSTLLPLSALFDLYSLKFPIRIYACAILAMARCFCESPWLPLRVRVFASVFFYTTAE